MRPSRTARRGQRHLVRIVAVSPHADDIAWSIGNTCRRLVGHGADLTLLTVFGSSLHTKSGVPATREAVTRLRKMEDEAFCEEIGCALHWLGLPDTPVNHSATPGRRCWLPPSLESADVILAPLAVGAHPDHAECFHALWPFRNKVVWYEDLPYAAVLGAAHARDIAYQQLGQRARALLVPLAEPAAKLRLVELYPSQLDEGLAQLLVTYCPDLQPAERLWVVGHTSHASDDAERTGRVAQWLSTEPLLRTEP